MKLAIFRNCSTALLVFTLLIQPLSANICVNEELKPLRRLRGVVVDYQGEPIANATISVTRSGAEVKATKTDSRGEFSFDGLGAGQYELKAEAKNFVKFDFPFRIAKPSAKSNQKIQLQLAVGGEDCSDIRLIGR